MTKICPFINQDEWKDFPSHKKDWKKSETSNKSITLHVGSFHTQNKDIHADMISEKKLHPAITVPFIRGRKLNTFLVFITQSCFLVQRI